MEAPEMQLLPKHGTKLDNDATVLVAMPPRNFWPPLTAIRCHHLHNVRCGPHITLLDPFVAPSHFSSAADYIKPRLLQAVGGPFNVTLSKLQFFQHSAEHQTVWIQPDSEDDKLSKLQAVLYKGFPQCDDVNTMSNKGFTAHLSIAKFYNLAETKSALLQLQRIWKPITWELTEIYMAHRLDNDTFQVLQAVSLVPVEQPQFGPAWQPGDNQEDLRLACSLFVGHLNHDEDTVEALKVICSGYDVKCCEVVKNPDGTSRYPLTVAEFKLFADCR
eukprot:TRINITY_DN63559_c0_g1_i2.p1 TRINITY_DN63559_c0_g1~~TRINITY_DN63559_c0_g1_i2.p1  ORF type:complete len:274 (+),score=13.70 TRINITY_DN63559_c0_g1_i2:30-851(+)